MLSFGVVKVLNVLCDILLGLLFSLISFTMNTFDFERVKEAFNHGVVVTISFATHALGKSIAMNQIGVKVTRVLTSTVRMMD